MASQNNVIDPTIPAQLSTLSQQAVVRPNSPPPGIAGFLFDIVGDEMIELTSSITDYYVENNTALQDQIALRPEQITVHGLVAELTDASVSNSRYSPPPDPLPLNPGMSPQLTPGTVQTQAQAADTTATTQPPSLYQQYKNTQPTPPNATKQTSAFLYFYQLWKSRQLFSVQTAWGIWNNCAILNLKADQAEDSRGKSEFTIVFKLIRIAGNVTTQIGQLAGRNAMQSAASSPTNNGQLPAGPNLDSALLTAAKSTFSGP